jgi:hypothetical protein
MISYHAREKRSPVAAARVRMAKIGRKLSTID